MNLMIPKLAVVSGRPTCTSMQLAETFDKRHDHVMRDIGHLVAQLSADHLPKIGEMIGDSTERLLNFEETFGEVATGKGAMRKIPMYRITLKGFTLLAMGFTGPKALQFKLAYIDAFEEMQKALAGQPHPFAKRMQRFSQKRGLPRLDRYQTRAVNQKAAAMGQQLADLCRDYLIWELAGAAQSGGEFFHDYVEDYSLQAVLHYASMGDVLAYGQARENARIQADLLAFRD